MRFSITLLITFLSLTLQGQELVSLSVFEASNPWLFVQHDVSFAHCGGIDTALYHLENDTLHADIYAQQGAITMPCVQTVVTQIDPDSVDSCDLVIQTRIYHTLDSSLLDANDTLINLCALSQPEIPHQKRVRIFPNPSDGWFQVEGIPVGTQVTVTDLTGRRVVVTQLPQNVLDLNGYPTGTYIVSFGFNGTTISRLIILD